MIAFVVLQRNE